MPTEQPMLYAHRGASADAPENTIPAIKLAWQQSADGAEIDVQLTRDNTVVVIHDAGTGRTTGRKGMVKNFTLNELQTLDAGAWKGPRWKGTPIPTLEEILNVVPAGKRLMIEIKGGPEIVPPLEKVIGNCRLKVSQVVFGSFSKASTRAARQHFPDHEIIQIAEFPTRHPDRLISEAVQNRLDGLSLHACPAINDRLVTRIRQHGLKLYVWTVNSPRSAIKYAGLGVTGIITNKPALLRSENSVVSSQ